MDSAVNTHILPGWSPQSLTFYHLCFLPLSVGPGLLSLCPGLCPPPRLAALRVFVPQSLPAALGFFVTAVGYLLTVLPVRLYGSPFIF